MKICEFSPCRNYRYSLWRRWNDDNLAPFTGSRMLQYLMVIGLNPSTADETKNDPTIRRCIDFAARWGYGSLCMTNLFAWRDTRPQAMKAQLLPVGMDNDFWLSSIANGAGMILAAWGKHGSHGGRDKDVMQILKWREVHCLKTNLDGTPMHPLYVDSETKPIIYKI